MITGVFTSEACVRSFSEVFGEDNVTVVSFGNVLSCIGAMEGLASSELTGKNSMLRMPAIR